MKHLWSRFFGKSKCESPIDENPMNFARPVWEVIEEAVNNVAVNYKTDLLSEPISYIVWAIWGQAENGEMDNVQESIFNCVQPAVVKAVSLLQIDGLKPHQSFAIEFVIRGLIISRIGYAMERLKSHMQGEKTKFGEKENDYLRQITPAGTA